MALDAAERRRIPDLEHGRQVRGRQAVGTLRHQDCEWVRTHQRMRLGPVVDLELRGRIHDDSTVC